MLKIPSLISTFPFRRWLKHGIASPNLFSPRHVESIILERVVCVSLRPQLGTLSSEAVLSSFVSHGNDIHTPSPKKLHSSNFWSLHPVPGPWDYSVMNAGCEAFVFSIAVLRAPKALVLWRIPLQLAGPFHLHVLFSVPCNRDCLSRGPALCPSYLFPYHLFSLQTFDFEDRGFNCWDASCKWSFSLDYSCSLNVRSFWMSLDVL